MFVIADRPLPSGPALAGRPLASPSHDPRCPCSQEEGPHRTPSPAEHDRQHMQIDSKQHTQQLKPTGGARPGPSPSTARAREEVAWGLAAGRMQGLAGSGRGPPPAAPTAPGCCFADSTAPELRRWPPPWTPLHWRRPRAGESVSPGGEAPEDHQGADWAPQASSTEPPRTPWMEEVPGGSSGRMGLPWRQRGNAECPGWAGLLLPVFAHNLCYRWSAGRAGPAGVR